MVVEGRQPTLGRLHLDTQRGRWCRSVQGRRERPGLHTESKLVRAPLCPNQASVGWMKPTHFGEGDLLYCPSGNSLQTTQRHMVDQSSWHIKPTITALEQHPVRLLHGK